MNQQEAFDHEIKEKLAAHHVALRRVLKDTNIFSHELQKLKLIQPRVVMLNEQLAEGDEEELVLQNLQKLKLILESIIELNERKALKNDTSIDFIMLFQRGDKWVRIGNALNAKADELIKARR